MTSTNFDQWGRIPGSSQVDLHRDVVFYKFENPFDVVFRNQKPSMLELEPYCKNLFFYSKSYIRSRNSKILVFLSKETK
jgi:hypothetical protein